jgi:hypothetical protein
MFGGMLIRYLLIHQYLSSYRLDIVWSVNCSSKTPFLTAVEDGSISIHQRGNYTAYDNVEGHVEVILLAFRSYNQTFVTQDNVVLRCVRANVTAEGSRVPAAGSLNGVPRSLVGLSVLAGLLAMF